MTVEIIREESTLPPIKEVVITLTPESAGVLSNILGVVRGNHPALSDLMKVWGELSSNGITYVGKRSIGSNVSISIFGDYDSATSEAPF